ncbi:MAG: Rrf2 family transcriptional regulator [Proteobacteria bacterium]|nr:Rrf2 family transcriptional regulator [Pseudomonadota bacterium]
MALFGSGVEIGLHLTVMLASIRADDCPSVKELAGFQGVSQTFAAKLFTRLEKAGIVESVEGSRGGFRLKRDAASISALEVIDAIEGHKPIFTCREIRGRCVLFDDQVPTWAATGVCDIHKLMIEAEQSMRKTLAGRSLQDIASAVGAKMPVQTAQEAITWFDQTQTGRGVVRTARRPRAKTRKTGGDG